MALQRLSNGSPTALQRLSNGSIQRLYPTALSNGPPLQVLRLLCLQSLTGGGIKAPAFDLLRRELLQTWVSE